MLARVLRRGVAIGLAVSALAAAAASASVIVYRCGNPAELCRINPDGTGQTTLTSDGANAAYQGASLDPAGTRMVFTRDTANLYAADGNAQNAVGPISTFAQLPKISFDGASVVDQEFYPSLNAYYICTFRTDGSPGSRTCNYGAARFPAFAPDGTIVASLRSGAHDKVCLMTAGSGCTRDLAVDPNADLDEAAISPDGQTLAVVAIPDGGTAGAGHIALYSVSSGQFIRNLTNGTADETPAFSPDGKSLVFARSGSLYTTSASASPGAETLLVRGGDTPTWGGGTSGQPGTPVSIQIGHPAKLKAGSLVRHGLVLTIGSSAPVAAEIVIALDSGTAHRLGLGRKQLVLATVTGLVTSKRTFDLRPGRAFRKRLGAARRFVLHVVVVVQDAAGHRGIRSYTVSVTR